MNEQEAIQKLREVKSRDIETYHISADELLIEFLKAQGFKELAEYYDNISNSFWYA